MRTIFLCILTGPVFSLSAQAQNSNCEKQARDEYQGATQRINPATGNYAHHMQKLGAELDEKLEACGIAVEGVHKASLASSEAPRVPLNEAALNALTGTPRANEDEEGCMHRIKRLCGKIQMGHAHQVQSCLLDHGNELDPKCLGTWRKHVITNMSRSN